MTHYKRGHARQPTKRNALIHTRARPPLRTRPFPAHMTRPSNLSPCNRHISMKNDDFRRNVLGDV